MKANATSDTRAAMLERDNVRLAQIAAERIETCNPYWGLAEERSIIERELSYLRPDLDRPEAILTPDKRTGHAAQCSGCERTIPAGWGLDRDGLNVCPVCERRDEALTCEALPIWQPLAFCVVCLAIIWGCFR